MTARGTHVKICGLCSAEDAAVAAQAGADAVGVVLAGGSRHVDVSDARMVFADVPSFVVRVGVFVDPSADEIVEAIELLGLSVVQLHGRETPEFCAAVGAPVIKAFRVGDAFDPGEVEPYRRYVAAVLLDTLVPGKDGGTGRAFAWDAALMPEGMPVVLAGGLAPENVGEAIRVMRPHGVDVSSGVESSPRHKDPARVSAFVAAVRAADEQGGER